MVGGRTVSWRDLEDVVLVEVQAPIQVGFHQLALVKRDGKRVITPATGLVKHGCRLERLQHDLVTMRDRYSQHENASVSDFGGGPGIAPGELGHATPSDGAVSPSSDPPEARVLPPNPDFKTPRTLLVEPRTGDVAPPNTLDRTVVKRDEQLIVAVIALIAAAFSVWSYLNESNWLTILGIAGALFFAWQAFRARRVRLMADEDGLRIQNESGPTRRVSWSDLDAIELSPRWTENGQTNWFLDFVTRDQRRIPDHKDLYDCPPGELYELAQTILAMRDHYASSGGRESLGPS
jgi:hypothetical protein